MDTATTSAVCAMRDGAESCVTHVTVTRAVMELRASATKERVSVEPAGMENTAQ